MIGTKDIVEVSLAQMAIVDLCVQRDGAFFSGRNHEAITRQVGVSRLNRVVIRHGVDGPHHVVVDEVADDVDGAVRVAVCARLQRAVWAQVPTLIDHLAVCICRRELQPCLVEIAYLRDERVADTLVLHDDVGIHPLTCRQVEGNRAERGKHLLCLVYPQSKDIDVEKVTAAQKVDGFLELLVVSVVEGNRGVACQPAMGGEGAVLPPPAPEAYWPIASCGIPGRWPDPQDSN